MKILIADDHAIVRQGLRRILEDQFHPSVLCEASNASEVLDQLSNEKWDLIILDISMPGKSGLDLLKDIKLMHPAIPVLILSMYEEDQYAMRVLKAGAAGYIMKDSAPTELAKAINSVLSKRKYVSPSLADHLVQQIGTADDRPLHKQLSDREFQVMIAIAEGKSAKVIAEQLSLSVKTVHTYRSRVIEKMNMKSNAEIIHYAMTHKLVQ